MKRERFLCSVEIHRDRTLTWRSLFLLAILHSRGCSLADFRAGIRAENPADSPEYENRAIRVPVAVSFIRERKERERRLFLSVKNLTATHGRRGEITTQPLGDTNYR